MSSRRDILVLGYGNELRGDDAAGPRVVASLEESNPDACQTLVRHQLTPELAETISTMRGVIFVDAAVGCSRLNARPLHPGNHVPMWDHRCGPADLLALSQQLFGRCPAAWQVDIPAEQFEFGADLSPTTAAAVPPACREVLSLCANLARP